MAKTAEQYWLFKTEPSTYSIDDLAAEKAKRTYWHGIRNYQARNFLRDQVRVGDQVLLYHSNADPSAIVGLAKIVKAGYPDWTAWDPQHDYHDPKSTEEAPVWYMVDVQLVRKFIRPLALQDLREHVELKEMELLRKGSRLSVQPVRPREFETVLKIAGSK
jgi:predicted RNA-binding protein with PUA-like domain